MNTGQAAPLGHNSTYRLHQQVLWSHIGLIERSFDGGQQTPQYVQPDAANQEGMQDLIVWDARLIGTPPAGNEVVRVDRWTDLDQMIFWAGWKPGQYGGDVSRSLRTASKR